MNPDETWLMERGIDLLINQMRELIVINAQVREYLLLSYYKGNMIANLVMGCGEN